MTHTQIALAGIAVLAYFGLGFFVFLSHVLGQGVSTKWWQWIAAFPYLIIRKVFK